MVKMTWRGKRDALHLVQGDEGTAWVPSHSPAQRSITVKQRSRVTFVYITQQMPAPKIAVLFGESSIFFHFTRCCYTPRMFKLRIICVSVHSKYLLYKMN